MFVRWLNHYGLIYCAIFGVPYSEGCRRFTELSCKKYCDVIFEGCFIQTALTFNLFMFTIGSAALGFGVGRI